MEGLGDLPDGDFQSFAYNTSANGSVVVGYGFSASGHEAFRWTNDSGMVGLGDLPGGGFVSGATCTSGDGSVVVGYGESASGIEAFRWTSGGGMVGLGDLPGGVFESWAYATSSDGSVIVGSGESSSGQGAFIWDSINGMRNLRAVLTNDLGLDLTGWTLQAARGVSGDGLTIVGQGINPVGNIEAWVAQIPEPTTLSLFVLGILLAKRRRRIVTLN